MDPLIMTLPLPPSVNHLYANTPSGRIKTREGRVYEEEVHGLLMAAHARSDCPDPPYEISLWFLLPNKRRRDVSNMVKAIEDAVSRYLMYDDACHHVMHLYKALDRNNPRAVIKLEHKSNALPAPPDSSFSETGERRDRATKQDGLPVNGRSDSPVPIPGQA